MLQFFSSAGHNQEVSTRRKITLVKNNAKCRYLKTLTW
jgi:hypothetical protein